MAEPKKGAPDDLELVARARRGGDEGRRAFEGLVRRHQAWMVRLVSYILGSQAEAEEIAQDAFLRAYTMLKGFRGESSFQSWLRVIATRLAYNRRMSSHSRQRRERLVGGEGEPRFDPRPGLEAHDALIHVLTALSYPYREILLLRYVEELSLQEIAQVLDIGLSATKMRLSRARVAFWQCYEERSDEEYSDER